MNEARSLYLEVLRILKKDIQQPSNYYERHAGQLDEVFEGLHPAMILVDYEN